MRIPFDWEAGLPCIHVLGLNRGTFARWPKLRPASELLPQLLEAAGDRWGPVPGLPGFAFGLVPAPGGAMVWIAREGAAILTCGLCWREEAAGEIWSFLLDLRGWLFGAQPGWLAPAKAAGRGPGALPWIAELSRTRELAFTTEEALALARFLCMLLPALQHLEA
jgi:hypothetical protein